MPARSRLLAASVAAIWGVNFVAIHLSLAIFPPLALAAIRFGLLAVPALLLVPRPAVPWRWIIGYGAGFGVAQFAFLYLAMGAGMPAGLASLVLQASAPFTVVLGAGLLGERLTRWQVAGVAVAAAGLGGIAWQRAGHGGGGGAVPVALTLLAALGWAFGNICARKAASEEPFRLMMWMTVVPPLPLLALSLVTEGPHRIAASFALIGTPAGLLAVAGLAYTVVVATVGGSGIWTALMSRYPSSAVAPYSMLVPVAGFGAAWLVLGERPGGADLVFGAVAVGGVLLATRPARSPGAGARRGLTGLGDLDGHRDGGVIAPRSGLRSLDNWSYCNSAYPRSRSGAPAGRRYSPGMLVIGLVSFPDLPGRRRPCRPRPLAGGRAGS